jgi:hypothetical protein
MLAQHLESTTLAADLKSGYPVLAADLNGDGRKDLACIGGATQNLMVFWNRP